MKIFNCNEYNFDSVNLDTPIKENDYYSSNLEFIIQTPKLQINKLNKESLYININESLEKCLTDFDNYLIKYISNQSEELFKEKYSIDDVEDIYKHSIKFRKNKEDILKCIYSNKLNIFNKYKELLELSDLTNSDNIICLIKCSKLIYYKTFCMPYWEILQIKLKENIINNNIYLFKEDNNDNYIEKNKLNLKLINLNN